jgi:hypothetical protein
MIRNLIFARTAKMEPTALMVIESRIRLVFIKTVRFVSYFRRVVADGKFAGNLTRVTRETVNI